MNAQDIFRDNRAVHVRELQTEVRNLRAELAAVREELAEWKTHAALGMLAAYDAAHLAEGTELEIVDGWNAVLGAVGAGGLRHAFASRDELIVFARDRVSPGNAGAPQRFIWIIFDGADEKATLEPGLRISYTGGRGPHRADRLITDYLRMRQRAGLNGPVRLVTADRDLAATAKRLGAEVLTPESWR